MLKKLIYILLFLCLNIVVTTQAQEVVVFYNVENLMDTSDDRGFEDEDMLPLADRGWDEAKYQTKLQAIARVVADLDMPVLMGLAEVENGGVLGALVGQEAIANKEYKFCHYESPDSRGVDVALLYRPDKFTVERTLAVQPRIDYPTRDILAVWGRLCGVEVFVAVVHFPSRIGGVKFTEPKRVACQEQLRALVDSVKRAEPHRRVIIMGDMNDNPKDKSLREWLRAVVHKKDVRNGGLYNPFACEYRKAYRGSSVYRGEWNMYDNIIIGEEFLSGKELQFAGRARVFNHPNLLDKKGYPLPTYRGVEYLSGVSDHLPVYLLLQ